VSSAISTAPNAPEPSPIYPGRHARKACGITDRRKVFHSLERHHGALANLAVFVTKESQDATGVLFGVAVQNGGKKGAQNFYFNLFIPDQRTSGKRELSPRWQANGGGQGHSA